MSKAEANKLETWGNETTMNLNNIVYQNIHNSPYFKSLYSLKTYHEVVDEIYYKVDCLDPFVKGTMASSAFCLLFKLWTLRLTVKQVNGLLKHTDSPYIRGLGFLYLRYVCKPANLWDWFEPYLTDDEELTIAGGPRPVTKTIGQLCRMLLTDLKFNGTILPRIPIPVARGIEEKLAARAGPTKSRPQSRNQSRESIGSSHRRSRQPRSRSQSRDLHRRYHRSARDRHPRSRSRSRSHERYRSDRSSRSYRRSRSRSRSSHRYRQKSPPRQSRSDRRDQLDDHRSAPGAEEGEIY
ncbi:hypothetical protein H4R34_004091 [Dimargaris verticillata]|uniref:Pre-mRNA-splicing factor 38 n=1 Tax=Dimargaris verticillata TaxID=2761393 RepID=A0A9W8B4Z6_9FUNG|nr:hypothetical protein H4R34_004091 [Dimargaris verticillata]